MTGQNHEQQPGYYGKVPSNGDFISRRLSEAFVEPWDRWLRSGLSASREQLGQAWMDCYLNGPIWRFAMSSGLLGPMPVAGVLMPSVDRVGRYFPLTIAVALPPDSSPFRTIALAAGWFQAAEDLALGCLEDPFDLNAFDAAVADLGRAVALDEGADSQQRSFPVSDHPCIQIAPGQSVTEVQSRLADQVTASALGGFGYWWTEGSVNVPPMARIVAGLPPPSDFSLLLTPGQGVAATPALDVAASVQ